MLDDFLVRGALAGIGVALAAGPLGCFIVWRRMAYFGDATAHAALLGVALALALALPVFPAVLLVALLLAVAVSGLAARGYPVDTILGVFAHGGLAVGLVVVALTGGMRWRGSATARHAPRPLRLTRSGPPARETAQFQR